MAKAQETISTDEFNIVNYGNNLNSQLEYITDKIKKAEVKITALASKESIINTMISRSNANVEKYHAENNAKMAGMHSSHILTQFETLGMVQEMLIKYEDQIQKYIKMSIDIENHKINAFVKLKSSKKDEESNDNGYEEIMKSMHELVTKSKEPGDHPGMLDEVKEQLKLEGY